MSIASLHIWSSIKIPSCVYAGKNKNRAESKVPYVDSWSKRKQEQESSFTTELINLRVPTSFTKRNSISDDSPDIYIKGSNHGRKLDKIESVAVPDVIGFHEIYGRNSEEDFDELSGSLDFDETSLDDGVRFDDIPSVKPWTAEELEKINKKYSLLEEKVKRESERKKKQTINITKRNVKPSVCLNEPKFPRDEDFNSEEKPSREFYSPTITSRRNYYETKLAELYMIELGIKR